MSLERDLLVRYLRQRRELGEREVFLDALTAADALTLLRAAPVIKGQQSAPAVVAAGGSVDGGATAGERATPESAGLPAGPEEPSAAAPSAVEGLRVLGMEATGCTRCRLHEGRHNVVFGEGNPQAELVVVGEAPGYEEDRTGRPFVGPAGKLLDLMLLSIGFPRESVYICNVLKCRPPNNRDPQSDEVAACSTYLHRQLDLIAPRALLAVGKFAAQVLTGKDVSIGQLRGRVHEHRGTPLVATYHPAFLLRSRQWTRAAWQDLQLLREVLDA